MTQVESQPKAGSQFGVRVREVSEYRNLAKASGGVITVGGLSVVQIALSAPDVPDHPSLYLGSAVLVAVLGVGIIGLGFFFPERWWPYLYPPGAIAILLLAPLVTSVILYFGGLRWASIGTVLYLIFVIFGFYACDRPLAIGFLACVGVDYAVLLAVSDGVPAKFPQWTFVMAMCSAGAVFMGSMVLEDLDRARVLERTARHELADVNASLESVVAEQTEEIRASRERIVAAADAERRSVERDLHDGAQQYLVVLRLKLGMLEFDMQDDPDTRGTVREIRADLDRALDELRRLAHGLYPAVLEEAGIAAALAETAETSAIPVLVEADGIGRYPRTTEAAVYFCCLEALQNAAKHAGDGARAAVQLREHDGHLQFRVMDDGKGYDTSRPHAPSGGMQNILDRVGALGGDAWVESAPGRGTCVTASIPVGDA